MKKGKDYIGVAAGAMVFNDKGELFLSKRSQNCKNERGHWETPGGSIELGETLEKAVKREMLEEYGAEIETIEQFPAADHLIPAEGQHWIATTFLARFKQGQEPKIMEPDRCDEIGWFALDKLPSPLSIITLADLKEYGQRKQPGHTKEPQSQLSARLAKAAQQVTVGARYMHYKQLSYKVLALALREEDNEPCVVYQAEYGDRTTWIRPVARWVEEVEVGGKKIKRFTKIER